MIKCNNYYLHIYEKTRLHYCKTGLMKGGVVPPGIEPGTHGFSVRCSTN